MAGPLIGALAVLGAEIIAELALPAGVVQVSRAHETFPGDRSLLTVRIFGRAAYSREVPGNEEFRVESALWAVSPPVLAILVGTAGGYWLTRRRSTDDAAARDQADDYEDTPTHQ
jgi:hypothetical protein